MSLRDLAVAVPQQHRRGNRRVAAWLSILLASVAMPAQAEFSGARAITDTGGGSQASPTTEPREQEIVVYGTRLFDGLTPERTLDPDAIDSYGVSTIDELIRDVQIELGNDPDQPLILVNGRRVNDISEIGGLPVEAVKNMQVLPRGSALRMGGTANQRVINISLKHEVKSATLTVAHKVSTDGGWNGDRGEAILTYVKGDRRMNVTVRGGDEDDLLESERSIIQPPPRLPYAIGGNIIGYPNLSGEIDPQLSALAGQPVTVVPLFLSGTPSLAGFAANANRATATDLGSFRDLRGRSQNYDVSSTFATRLAPWLTGDATLRWSRNTGRSLRGLPSALFILSPTNPASVFSNPVGIAVYGRQPLENRSRNSTFDASATLDADWGNWQGNLNLRHSNSNDVSLIEREATFGNIALPDTVDPFNTDLSQLIGLQSDRTSGRQSADTVDLTIDGSALKLPAGNVFVTVEGRLVRSRLQSESTFSIDPDVTFRRNEQTFRGAVEVPLTSRDNNFLPQLGDLSASLEYAHSHYSDAGSGDYRNYALTWEPRPAFRVHASIEHSSAPPSIETIANPLVITPDVRVFDPLTGRTVDVTQITGGNNLLLPQTTDIRQLTTLLNLVPKIKLQLNADYTDTNVKNFVSSLPEASAAVMLALPDRFIRDANGELTTIDLRPINFESHHDKRLRWGFSMNRKLSGGALPGAMRDGQPITPSTYLQLTASHTMVFSDEIRVSPGLSSVDLLHGGAIGIGGGRTRHQFDGIAAINSGGIGARLGVTWRGSSELDTRINGIPDTLHFSPLLLVNLRAFADLKRFLPGSAWAKRFRVSLDAINIANERQTVRADLGRTPLQYQPGYRDPLGRTIEFEVRNVF